MSDQRYKITVFTATYNRGQLLTRLHESLCRQQMREMEWLVVDDGSTDDTAAVVAGFIAAGNIDIRYQQQAHSGKHRAINRGVAQAQGELFFIVDSDDYLPDDALATIVAQWDEVRDNPAMGGVAGLDGRVTGKRIGTGLPSDHIDCSAIDIRNHYHVRGDLAEVFRTAVLRQYPFPEIEGETFCPEDLIWNRVTQEHKLRYFNKIIYIADYQRDGLSSRHVANRMDSPVAVCTHYCELNGYDIPVKQKAKAAINYWRFRACVPRGKQVPKLPWYWSVVGWPAGIAMHRRDVSNRARQQQ